MYTECNVTSLLQPGDIVALTHVGNLSKAQQHPFLVEVDTDSDVLHGLLDYSKFVIKEAFCGSGKMSAKRIRIEKSMTSITSSNSDSSKMSHLTSEDEASSADSNVGGPKDTFTSSRGTTAMPWGIKHVLEQPANDIGGQIINPFIEASADHNKMESTAAASAGNAADSPHHLMGYPWDWRQLNTTASVIEGSYCVVGNYDKDMHVALLNVNLAAEVRAQQANPTALMPTVSQVSVESTGTTEEILSSFELAEAALVWGGIYDGECIKIGCEHYTVVSGAGPPPIGTDIRPCPPPQDDIYAPLWSGDETISGIDKAGLLSGGGDETMNVNDNLNGSARSGNDGGNLNGTREGMFHRLVDEIERGIERTVVNMPLVQPQIDSEHDDPSASDVDAENDFSMSTSKANSVRLRQQGGKNEKVAEAMEMDREQPLLSRGATRTTMRITRLRLKIV